MDEETAARVKMAYELVRDKRAELGASREMLRAEMDRALEAGAKKHELAKLLGITRQAVQEFFR